MVRYWHLELKMAEKLLEEIQTGQFLPLTLTIEPLQRILAEILALMKDHDAKIKIINEALGQKPDRSELSQLSNNTEKFAEHDQKLNDLLGRLEGPETKLGDTQQNSALDEIQKRQTDFEEDANKRLNELKEALDGLKSQQEKDAELHDQVAELKKQLNGMESMNERLENLEKDVSLLKTETLPKLEQELDSTKQKLNDLETKLNALELRERSIPRPPSSGDSNSMNPRSSEGRVRARTFADRDSPQKQSLENEEMLNTLKADVAALKVEIEQLKKDMLERPDRVVIERLFAQFKKSFAGIVEMIETAQGQNANFATLDDLRKLEAKIKQVNMEIEEAAAARKGMTCLSCGQPYRTVTNSIQDQQTMSILGAAPIAQVTDGRQTIVYGSDHELYYSCPSVAHTQPFAVSPTKTLENE